MRALAHLALACLGASCCAGCLGKQFACDGSEAQVAMSQIYTDQAMDNLIRAKNNLPFVQLRFYDINVNDSDDYAISGQVTQSIQTVRDLFAAAATRTVSDQYGANGAANRRRVMALNADPVTDQNDIYERYLAFANDPGLLMCGDAPPEGPVHLLRKWCKRYYWVPCEAGPAFLDLVLKTALMRGPEAVSAAPAAYEVRIGQVIDVKPVGDGRDATNATLIFDKAVPNGEATLIVDLDDGRRVRASLTPVDKDAEGKRVFRGQPTTRLNVQWAPKADGFTELNLQGRPGRLYSRDFPPEAPVANPLLRRISTDVNQIKVNQFTGR
jgi:hypothetical protein